MENINSPNTGRDLLLANNLRSVPWGIERMLQRIKRHRSVTLHKSAHPKREQDQRENLAMVLIDYKMAYDIVPQNCLKMYKISDEVINFIEKTIKTCKVELTAAGRSLTKAKVERDKFQGDVLSPLLFLIPMIPLNHILRKCTAGYKLMYFAGKYQSYDIKLFSKNEKELETNTCSKNIQSAYWDGIWHRKMCHTSNEKR